MSRDVRLKVTKSGKTIANNWTGDSWSTITITCRACGADYVGTFGQSVDSFVDDDGAEYVLLQTKIPARCTQCRNLRLVK